MIFKVNKTSNLKGKVLLPASKSYSIRAFIIAACGGKSEIINPSNCDDSKVSIQTAKTLNAKVKEIKKNVFCVDASIKGKQSKSIKTINVKESGTALRFILPLLSLRNEDWIIDGKGTLIGRPNLFLTEALRSMNVDIKGTGPKESIPIRINKSIMRAGSIKIDGSLSSQFISALLIAAPQLSQDTHLTLIGDKLVSSDYITMTLSVLEKTGIKIKNPNNRTYEIRGNQKFKGLKKFHVPSDYGLAAFLLVAGVLTKSDIVLSGYFDQNLIQADGHIINLIEKMGVKLIKTRKSIKIKGPFELKGGNFSLKDCPDLVPIMSILALFAKGKTRLYDIKHARAKESDRISDLRKELLKIDADVSETDNELIINPKLEYKTGCLLDPHNDHRLAMSFAVLGLKVGAIIKDMECCSKSYPDFPKDFKAIGAKVIK